MEGTEKIQITHPDLTHRDKIGQVVRNLYKAQIDVWAKRHDQRGREIEIGETETTDFNTIFEIREFDAVKYISESWKIRDQYGLDYDIQAVSRLRRYTGRYRILLLYAKRRA